PGGDSNRVRRRESAEAGPRARISRLPRRLSASPPPGLRRRDHPPPVYGPDTVVFIPAWNEERALPGVLDEVRAGLPGADVLVIDDGSTDWPADVAGRGRARRRCMR